MSKRRMVQAVAVTSINPTQEPSSDKPTLSMDDELELIITYEPDDFVRVDFTHFAYKGRELFDSDLDKACSTLVKHVNAHLHSTNYMRLLRRHLRKEKRQKWIEETGHYKGDDFWPLIADLESTIKISGLLRRVTVALIRARRELEQADEPKTEERERLEAERLSTRLTSILQRLNDNSELLGSLGVPLTSVLQNVKDNPALFGPFQAFLRLCKEASSTSDTPDAEQIRSVGSLGSEGDHMDCADSREFDDFLGPTLAKEREKTEDSLILRAPFHTVLGFFERHSRSLLSMCRTRDTSDREDVLDFLLRQLQDRSFDSLLQVLGRERVLARMLRGEFSRMNLAEFIMTMKEVKYDQPLFRTLTRAVYRAKLMVIRKYAFDPWEMSHDKTYRDVLPSPSPSLPLQPLDAEVDMKIRGDKGAKGDMCDNWLEGLDNVPNAVADGSVVSPAVASRSGGGSLQAYEPKSAGSPLGKRKRGTKETQAGDAQAREGHVDVKRTRRNAEGRLQAGAEKRESDEGQDHERVTPVHSAQASTESRVDGKDSRHNLDRDEHRRRDDDRVEQHGSCVKATTSLGVEKKKARPPTRTSRKGRRLKAVQAAH